MRVTKGTNNINGRRKCNIGCLPSHDAMHGHDCGDTEALKLTVFLVFLDFRRVRVLESTLP
jgi:hypothetical protein